MLHLVTVFAAAVAVTLAAPAPEPNPVNVFMIDITPEEAQKYLANLPFNQPQLSTRTKVLPLVRYDSPQFRSEETGPSLGHYWKNGKEIQNVDDYVDEVYDASQYHGQDGLGAYAYGYRTPESSKVENRERSGDLQGSYTYKDGNNNDILIRYWADKDGFHQEDNLPKVELKPVEETEEVKQARLAHEKAWQEAAAAAALNPDNEPQQQPQYTGGNYQYQASGSALQVVYQPLAQPQQGYQGLAQPTPYQHAASEQQVAVAAPEPNQSQLHEGKAYSSDLAQPTQYQQAASEQQVVVAAPGPNQNQLREGKAYSSAQASYQGQQFSQPQQFGKPQSFNQPQKYAQQGQYQQNQYQSGQPQQVQQASYSQQSSQYSQSSQHQSQHDENAEPEPTGPPRGFFYSFDYPVNIIVRKDAQGQNGNNGFVNPGTPIDHDTVGVGSRRFN